MSESREHDGNSKVAYREFDRAVTDLHEEITSLKENLKDENSKTEKFLLDNISMMRVGLSKEIEHVEERTSEKLTSLQTTIKATAEQLRLANDKIVSAMEVRLTGMNEFRAENQADRSKYATKDDVNLRFNSQKDDTNLRFDSFRKEFDLSMEGIRKEMRPLQTMSNEAAGGYRQSQDTWTKAGVIVVGALAALDLVLRLIGH